MTRFRDLLAHDPTSTPTDEQRRASAELADVVRRSHMKWWKDGKPATGEGSYLLIAVAPYSQYDLTLLDFIEERLAFGPARLPVLVANVLDYSSIEDLNKDFFGIVSAQTPLAVCCDTTAKCSTTSGKNARDAIAGALGLSADDLSRQILADAPSFRNNSERAAK